MLLGLALAVAAQLAGVLLSRYAQRPAHVPEGGDVLLCEIVDIAKLLGYEQYLGEVLQGLHPEVCLLKRLAHCERAVVRQEHGIRLVRAKQMIRAILASPELADTLGINTRSALLFIERISFSQENVPVEFLRIYYRADRYVLYNELQG